MLRPDDKAYLESREIDHEVVSDAAGTHVILADVPTPQGLQPDAVDILITLPAGFNDTAPDMFWCQPAITRVDGTPIPGTGAHRDFQGRNWQRWSRHIGGAWRPGIDNLATYIAYVKRAILDVGVEAA